MVQRSPVFFVLVGVEGLWGFEFWAQGLGISCVGGFAILVLLCP